MARAIFVKSARKDNPEHGIKKGESYYWWKFRFGGKHYSKTAPKQSQLTSSDFLSQVYSIEERLAEVSNLEEAVSERDEVVEELRGLADEQEEKRSNMPEGLQDGPTGELLQGRYDSCNEFADELEAIDLDIEKDEDESDEDFQSRVDDVINELQSCSYSGE